MNAEKCVMSIIVGAQTSEQLSDNIAAARLTLSTDDLAAVDAASALRPEYPAGCSNAKAPAFRRPVRGRGPGRYRVLNSPASSEPRVASPAL